MSVRRILLISILLVLGLVFLLFFFRGTPDSTTFVSGARPSEWVGTQSEALTVPVPGFIERISKKPFGIYITPDTSPVQPERFSGYHTGVDVEFPDTAAEVPVVAIANGTVVYRDRVSGYGGVIILSHQIGGRTVHALYGHLDVGSLVVSVGEKVVAGQHLGVLGEGFSSETDGERKHLHLSISTERDINLRGYVQSRAELSAWLDPLSLYEGN